MHIDLIGNGQPRIPPVMGRLLMSVAGGAAGVSLTPLIGGRSAAQIFRASFSGDPAERPPVVLKIGPRAHIERERSSYARYVLMLPSSVRPQLLGFSASGDEAGLCYSLLGGNRPSTLTDRLMQGEIGAIGVVLETLIGPLRANWYAPSNIRLDADIAERYRSHYFSGRMGTAETELVFGNEARRLLGILRKGRNYGIPGEDFPRLHETLFGDKAARAYRSCTVHGDLNSDNILLTAEPGTAGFVDFHKTGRGHVFEDLVAIESSIRINHLSEASGQDILATERAIALGEATAGDYAAAILKVRAAAKRCFPNIAGDNGYSYAVAAIGLRLMHAIDLSDTARARIIASTLWAAKLLDACYSESL